MARVIILNTHILMAQLITHIIAVMALLVSAQSYCGSCEGCTAYSIDVSQNAVDMLNIAWARELGITLDPTSRYDVSYVVECNDDSFGRCSSELEHAVVEFCEFPLNGVEKCVEMSIYKASVETYRIVSQFIGRVPSYESMHILT
jgi:hypothetical protein